MTHWPDLSQRSTEPELMDLPDSDADQLNNTLRQFRWINRLITPCHRLLARYFLTAMRKAPNRAWTLLDVGAGAGDLAIWLNRECQRSQLNLTITCLDHDERVVAFAKQNCRSHSNIHVIAGDAMTLADRDQKWDFVFANHFLHHLTNDQIVMTLRAIHESCRVRYVLSDIHRSRLNYILYTAAAGLFLRNSFAYFDGRLSIRKGFTWCECQEFLSHAELAGGAEVRRAVPGHVAFISLPKGNL